MSQALRPMGFFDSVALTLLRSLDYGGRSSRLEFGCWLGLAPLIGGAMTGLYHVVHSDTGRDDPAAAAVLALAALLLLAMPGLPLAVRRLHDLGRGANWLLVPILGVAAAFALVLLVLFGGGGGMIVGTVVTLGWGVVPAMLVAGCLLPSQPGPNRFGPRPTNEVPA